MESAEAHAPVEATTPAFPYAPHIPRPPDLPARAERLATALPCRSDQAHGAPLPAKNSFDTIQGEISCISEDVSLLVTSVGLREN
jgi:hypothetical protein